MMSCGDLNFVCLDHPNLDQRIDSDVFYLIDVNSDCDYTIISPCAENRGKLKFDGSSFYINLKEPSGFIQLFDFEEGSDSLAVANCDTKLRGTTVQFELVKRYTRNDEKINLIKVSANKDLEIFGMHTYHFFLSNKSGVIGSYLKSDSMSNVILQKRGDILETEIDYSEVEFKGLEYFESQE